MIDDTATESTRERLVSASIDLLRDEGPQAIRAREVTAAIGSSTMAVYQHFGGMPQLLAAVCDEGFRRLGARFAAMPRSGDPVTDACRLALVHRAVARENPHLYDLMFGLAGPGGQRRAAAAQDEPPPPGFQAAYDQLVALAAALVAAGRVRPGDPDAIAAQLWSFAHGYVTLELAGHMARFGDDARAVLLPLAANVLTGLGDDHARAVASAAAAYEGPSSGAA